MTDSVDDNQMATVIADNPVEEIPFALADAAVSAGSIDNITVIALQIVD